MDQNIFTIVSIIPIGLLIPKIENDYCIICRGPLTLPCCECIDDDNNDCDYLEDHHMHSHCYVVNNTLGKW